MRKWFAVLALLAVLWIPVAAHAQAQLRFSSVKVEIWPEYDRPAVLVISTLILAPDTALPARVSLRVPAQAEVYAVAVQDPARGLLNATYDRSVQGDWAVLTLTANSAEVRVEYYDALVKDPDGKRRHISYQWAGDNAVDAFSVIFQQPVGATDLIINPTPAGSTVGQDNLTYYQSQAVSLSAGQVYTLTADYKKQTEDLSASGLPVQPVSPVGATTTGRFSLTGVLPWILGGLGVVLVGGAVFMLIMWQRGGRGSNVRKRHVPGREESSSSEEIYCPQCGKRAQAGDLFCRTCGTRLRRAE